MSGPAAGVPGPQVAGWWARTVGGLPRAFWVLVAGTFVNRLGQFVQPFLALYLVSARGVGVATAGLLVACLGAGAVVSQPLGGFLADRLGRRVTLVGGMLATAAALGVLGSARPLWSVAAGAVLLGLVADVYRPAAQAAVADLVPAADRPRAFALVYWAVNLGVSVSGVLGGVLAERGWWLLFALDAATCVVFAAVVARWVPETRGERDADDRGGYGPVLRDRLVVVLAVLTLLGACVYGQSFVALPLTMASDGLPPSAYGFAYAVNPVLIVVVQPLTFAWLRRLSPVRVYAGSVLLMGAGFFLTAFAHTTVQYAGTVAVWTLGELAFNAIAPTIVSSIAPDRLRGRYNGLIGLAYGGSALLGPVLGTRALDAGRLVVWGGALAVSAVVAVLTLLIGPALRRRMTLVEQVSR